MRANSSRWPLDSVLHDFPGRHRINASTIWGPVTGARRDRNLRHGAGGRLRRPGVRPAAVTQPLGACTDHVAVASGYGLG